MPPPPDNGWVITIRCMRVPNPTSEEIRWIETFIQAFNLYRKGRLYARSAETSSYIEREIREDAHIIEHLPPQADLRQYWLIRNLDSIFPNKLLYIKAKDAVAWMSRRNVLRNPHEADTTQAALLFLDRLEAE